MNRFTGSLAIITTISYHNYKIAITITHNQLTLFRYPWAKFHTQWTLLTDTRLTSQLLNSSSLLLACCCSLFQHTTDWLTETRHRLPLYSLGTDHAKKTQPFYCCITSYVTSQRVDWSASRCRTTDNTENLFCPCIPTWLPVNKLYIH
jgi:hypothetical protein